jgi:hypothetical protein
MLVFEFESCRIRQFAKRPRSPALSPNLGESEGPVKRQGEGANAGRYRVP